ncbi:hypothetical protein ABW20_dc0101607 [Dactylellina cionopaga]|nr:hypothetical protein ABW20_dc0101607 [Dactylellina cionopaga]
MLLNLNRRILTTLICLFAFTFVGTIYTLYNASISSNLSKYIGPARAKLADIVKGGAGVGVDEDDDEEEDGRYYGDTGNDCPDSTKAHHPDLDHPDEMDVHPKLLDPNTHPTNTSALLCFQIQISGEPDNFCVARNALYDPSPPPPPPITDPKDYFPGHGQHGRRVALPTAVDGTSPEPSASIERRQDRKRWSLSCNPVTDYDRGVQPPNQFGRYFSDTGPGTQLSRGWDYNIEAPAPKNPSECKSSIMLVGMEGNINFWHTTMELWSAFLTMEALRKAVKARERLFGTDKNSTDIWDEDNVEIYVQSNLAKEQKGAPIFDMWNTVVGKPLKDIKELKKGCYKSVILPLPGGANPFWKDHWKQRNCEKSTLMDTFVERVLRHYKIDDAEIDKASEADPEKDKVRVSIISRQHNRRILGMDGYIKKLQQKYADTAIIEPVILENLTIAEQFVWARKTDVLVGVIGAGMTHTMFIREGAAVVEFMHPEPFWYFGFGNIARQRRLEYFAVHGEKIQVKSEGWQTDDVQVSEKVFVDALSKAIEGQKARKQNGGEPSSPLDPGGV